MNWSTSIDNCRAYHVMFFEGPMRANKERQNYTLVPPLKVKAAVMYVGTFPSYQHKTMSRRKPCKKTLPPIFSPHQQFCFFNQPPRIWKFWKKKPQKHKRALIFLIFHFWKCEKKGSTEDDTFNLFVTSLVERIKDAAAFQFESVIPCYHYYYC
jgi:hypothetical protein